MSGRVLRWIALALALYGAPVLAQAGADDAARVRDCFAQMRSHPEASIALADALLDVQTLAPELRVRALVCAGQARQTIGNADVADEFAQQAVRLLDDGGLPAAERVQGYAAVAAILLANGAGYRAIALMEGASRLAQESGDPGLRLIVLDMLGMIRASYFEDHAGAEPHFAEAVALAESLGRGAAQRDYNHALNLVSLDRMDEAEQTFDRAMARVAAPGTPDLLRYRIQANRTDVFVARGDHRRARVELEQAIAGQGEVHDLQGEAVSRARLAAVMLTSGDTAAAIDAARHALALAEQGRFVREQREAMEVLVRALAASGEPAQALAVLERLRALEVQQLKAQNLRGMAVLQGQLQNDAMALENERLQHQATRARLMRNLAIVLLVLVVLSAGAAAWYQHRLRRRLWRLGAIDPLTNLFNRREAARRLDALAAGRSATALLLVDIDHFKAVNDQRGHEVGDQVLVQLAAHLRTICRADDVVARWGGEEFLIACPGLSLAQAEALAERLRASVAAMRVRPRSGPPFSVAVSIGFAPFAFHGERGEGTWKDAVRLADRALYAAKHSGRDAWAGIWGKDAQDAPVLSVIEAELAQAARAGWIELRGSRVMRWQSTEVERRSVATFAGPGSVAPVPTTP